MPMLGLSVVMSNRKPALAVLEMLKTKEERTLARVIEDLSLTDTEEWKAEIAAIEIAIRLLREDIERQEGIEELKS